MSANEDNRQQRHDEPRAYARERDEPTEKPNPVPVTFLVFAAIIVVWGVSYFYWRSGTLTGAGDMRTPVVAEAGGGSGAADGGAIFAANCVSCHQASGQGLAGVFPPLDGSGWVTAKAEVPVQILLHGIGGKIEVKGTTYRSVMPSFATLSDAEIAAVVTHIRQSWSNKAGEVTADFVAGQRKATEGRSTPWAGGAEIRKVVGGPE